MAEGDRRLCMSPDIWDNSNDFSVVDRLSIATSGRIGPLPLLIFARDIRDPGMVSQMLQNSTTCTFIFNNLYLCSTTYIYIQHFVFIFNNTHFQSTSTKILFIQQHNICSTSTKNNFIQQQYLFNFNPNDFHSTKIIVQPLPKSFSFNNNICLTSTTVIFIQQ